MSEMLWYLPSAARHAVSVVIAFAVNSQALKVV